MKAVILSAGLGTRLRPLTNKCPKVMVRLLKKPILEWHIERLKSFDVKDILINLHYFPETIADYFQDGKKFGVKITYSYEPTLLGTAGTIKNLQEYLNESFLVIYGDVVHWLDFRKLIQYHRAKRGSATLVVGQTDRPRDCDLLELDDDNKITDWYPKPHKIVPKRGFSNEALYLLEPEIIKFIPDKKPPIDFGHDVMATLIKKRVKMYGYPLEEKEYVEDMGTLKRLEKIKKEWPDIIKT